MTFGASILVRGTLRLEPFVLLPDAGRSRGRHKGPVRAAAGAHAAHHCPRRGTLQPPKAEHVEGKCALSRANANAALSQQPVARDARGPQVRPPLSTRSRRSRIQTATMRLPLTAARSTDPRVSGVGCLRSESDRPTHARAQAQEARAWVGRSSALHWRHTHTRNPRRLTRVGVLCRRKAEDDPEEDEEGAGPFACTC